MKKVTLLTVFTLLCCLGFSFAEVPCKINYQGRLIKDGVPVNGPADMEFKLYTQLTGGTPIKTIPMSSVPVYNGLFRAVLDLEGINWAAGETIYLEVKVGTEILTPREEIYAYPYAINTRFLEGKAKDYFINTSTDTQRKDGGLNIMGNVGIGTTSPGQKLDVDGHLRLRPASVPTAANGVIYYDSSTNKFRCYENGVWVDCRSSGPRWTVKVCDANSYTLPSQFISPIAQFSLPSLGSIGVTYSGNTEVWLYDNSVLFTMRVNSQGSNSKQLKLFGVDNEVYVYLNGGPVYSKTSAWSSPNSPETITLNLINGNNTIDIVFRDWGGAAYLSLLGDLVDDSLVKFIP